MDVKKKPDEPLPLMEALELLDLMGKALVCHLEPPMARRLAATLRKAAIDRPLRGPL